MKKLVAVALVLVLTFGLTSMAFASQSGQNPNQNPGSPSINAGGLTITVTGGGNNLQIRAILNADPSQSVIVARQGNGTFNQPVAAFGYVYHIWVQGNSLVRSELVSAPQPPYVCEDICEGCNVCLNCYECECVEPVEPIVVRLGFIGYYFHPSRCESYGPMTTSFFWLTLNEGETIDWNAVEAAYSNWVAQGGLVPDFATGWRSSGFAPITFAHGAAIGHGDFSFPQLEGFYRAYFVTPGFIWEPPYVCNDICEECGMNNCADCDACVCLPADVFYSDTWAGRVNVQGGNNGIIAVTVNGVAFQLTVNAQQAGTRTHNVDGLTVEVTVNDNNVVTRVAVTSTVANVPVVINNVVSLTPGNQQ